MAAAFAAAAGGVAAAVVVVAAAAAAVIVSVVVGRLLMNMFLPRWGNTSCRDMVWLAPAYDGFGKKIMKLDLSLKTYSPQASSSSPDAPNPMSSGPRPRSSAASNRQTEGPKP